MHILPKDKRLKKMNTDIHTHMHGKETRYENQFGGEFIYLLEYFTPDNASDVA